MPKTEMVTELHWEQNEDKTMLQKRRYYCLEKKHSKREVQNSFNLNAISLSLVSNVNSIVTILIEC